MTYRIVQVQLSEAEVEKIADQADRAGCRAVEWGHTPDYGLQSEPLLCGSGKWTALKDFLASAGVELHEKDITGEYGFFLTDSEPAYDGFGTFTVEEKGPSKNFPSRQLRVVAICKEHEQWQRVRYMSGLRASFPVGAPHPW